VTHGSTSNLKIPARDSAAWKPQSVDSGIEKSDGATESIRSARDHGEALIPGGFCGFVASNERRKPIPPLAVSADKDLTSLWHFRRIYLPSDRIPSPLPRVTDFRRRGSRAAADIPHENSRAANCRGSRRECTCTDYAFSINVDLVPRRFARYLPRDERCVDNERRAPSTSIVRRC